MSSYFVRETFFRPIVGRESLAAPGPYETVYYFSGLNEIQRRLMADIMPVLRRMLEQQYDQGGLAWEGRILPFRRLR